MFKSTKEKFDSLIIGELQRNVGIQFDSQLVDVFIEKVLTPIDELVL